MTNSFNLLHSYFLDEEKLKILFLIQIGFSFDHFQRRTNACLDIFRVEKKKELTRVPRLLFVEAENEMGNYIRI